MLDSRSRLGSLGGKVRCIEFCHIEFRKMSISLEWSIFAIYNIQDTIMLHEDDHMIKHRNQKLICVTSSVIVKHLNKNWSISGSKTYI